MNTFWINDLSILFSKNHFLEVIPLSSMKFNNKLNAIFRLSIYYFLIITLINKNIKNIVVPIFVGIVTVVLYNYYRKFHNINESNDNNNNISRNSNNLNISSDNDSGIQGCKMPTKNNPFMNAGLYDFSTGNLEKSCNSYNNSVIRDLEKINYNNDLYKDQFDIFDKENGNRQFYTMPVNSIVNDQGAFAEWCYSRAPTCKEGNGIQCFANLPSSQNVSGGPGGKASGTR